MPFKNSEFHKKMSDEIKAKRNFIEVTIRTALAERATDRQLAQVPKLQDKFDDFDLSQEENKELSNLLLQCYVSPNILKKAKARKFLNQIFHKIFYRISDFTELYQKTLRECKRQ